MPEPASSTAVLVITAGGIAVFGVVTGLHPQLLITGLAGGLWALFYGEPQALWRRVASAMMGSVVAAWCAPVVAFGLPAISFWPKSIPSDLVQFPVALTIGFLAMRILGPGLMAIASRKIEEAAK